MDPTKTVEALQTFVKDGSMTESAYHGELIRVAHRHLMNADPDRALLVLSFVPKDYFESVLPELMVNDPELAGLVQDLFRQCQIFGLLEPESELS